MRRARSVPMHRDHHAGVLCAAMPWPFTTDMPECDAHGCFPAMDLPVV